MSEYRRLISYLYTYNNGLKNKNAGFAKVERKGGTVRLQINIKETFSPEEDLRVYFFLRRDGKIAGVEMGKLEIKGSSGEFRTVCQEEALEAAFDELCGLYIKGNREDRLFASQWDDGDFLTDRIVLLKDMEEKTPAQPALQEDRPAPGTEAAHGADSEPGADSASGVKAAAADAVSEELPVWERPIRQEVYVTQKELEEKDFQESLQEKEPLRIAEEAEEEPSGQDIRNSRYDSLFDGKEPVLVFSEDEIYDCIDIGLDDLARLPKEAAALRNNSFVNHGCYNFHHLLLGRKDGDILVVGVPGIYNRRERMTANMFGFDKFKFSMRNDVRANHFGYWYKEF